MLTEVADRVWVHRSALLENNTVIVEGHDGVMVVDAGITAEEMECLARDLRERGLRVVAGFSTHPDWDHVLWHPDLGDAPRYGTARCAAAMRAVRSETDWRSHVLGGLPPEIADDVPLETYGLITGIPAGVRSIPWDGPRIRVIEHPAHSPGHAALLIDERRVLVAGDMLSDVLVPMLDEWRSDEDPIEGYLRGLDTIERMTDGVAVLIPGHGSHCDAADLRERIDLDRGYVRALRDGDDVDDPRIGVGAKEGWEWVSNIHEAQVRSAARGRSRDLG